LISSAKKESSQRKHNDFPEILLESVIIHEGNKFKEPTFEKPNILNIAWTDIIANRGSMALMNFNTRPNFLMSD